MPLRGSIIWLHGLGASNDNFLPVVDYLGLREQGIRFVFPQAPDRAVSINQGMRMPAWYDILGPEIGNITHEDTQGIRDSEKAIINLIAREVALGVPANRVFLAGFSQGGAMVLHTGLRFHRTLAGIIALSTYLPLSHQLSEERHLKNQKTPIFQAHGSFDPVVPLYMGQACRQHLTSLGYSVQWHGYDMAHVVLPEETMDIKAFLQNIISTWV